MSSATCCFRCPSRTPPAPRIALCFRKLFRNICRLKTAGSLWGFTRPAYRSDKPSLRLALQPHAGLLPGNFTPTGKPVHSGARPTRCWQQRHGNAVNCHQDAIQVTASWRVWTSSKLIFYLEVFGFRWAGPHAQENPQSFLLSFRQRVADPIAGSVNPLLLFDPFVLYASLKSELQTSMLDVKNRFYSDQI